jgi:flagellar motor switch protein FliM
VGDVLSQSEIDSLLQALNSGEVDAEEMKKNSENQVKEYDFARPSKFSKEHLRTLEMIFEHYGRLLSTNLPIYLRKNIQVEVMNAEAISYMEFSNALSNPVLLGVIDFSPLKGNIIIEMASKLGYTIVDRLLGGNGDPLDKLRDFSEIELLLIERIMNVCVNLLREPWANVLDTNPRLERIETNSQFAQIISPSEMTAVITVNIKIGDVEGLMNVCLPYITLEPIMDKLNTKFWYSNMQEKDDQSYNSTVERLINKSAIPVNVVLGKTSISVNDFASLRPGDIIRLDTKVDDELSIYVGDIKKFNGLPGTRGKKYAVRVTKVIREEKEEDELRIFIPGRN